tara:strand:- start:69 stop:182 length:114 start_codon:yes stop_codon:yes gene_type:complete
VVEVWVEAEMAAVVKVVVMVAGRVVAVQVPVGERVDF